MKHITEDIAHGNVCKGYVAYFSQNSKSYISFSIKIGSRMSNIVLVGPRGHHLKKYNLS